MDIKYGKIHKKSDHWEIATVGSTVQMSLYFQCTVTNDGTIKQL